MSIVIPPEFNESRLDRAAAQLNTDYSRASWVKFIKQGWVKVNNLVATNGKQLVYTDDEIMLDLPDSPEVEIDLPIIFEDDDVLVLNKPSGILTHAKGALLEEATVADFIRPRTTDAPDSNRPGIVHRLDRDTSGVLIAAKNNEAKRWLQKQFSERKVKKSYLALVDSQLEQDHAIIDLPIARDPKKPQLFRVDANGKQAITEYCVQQKFADGTSLIELWPMTGRTHQLRVHMAYLKAPIVGDPFYNPKKALIRLFLHAHSLEITLPSRERKVFTAPLAPDLEAYLASLESIWKAGE